MEITCTSHQRNARSFAIMLRVCQWGGYGNFTRLMSSRVHHHSNSCVKCVRFIRHSVRPHPINCEKNQKVMKWRRTHRCYANCRNDAGSKSWREAMNDDFTWLQGMSHGRSRQENIPGNVGSAHLRNWSRRECHRSISHSDSHWWILDWRNAECSMGFDGESRSEFGDCIVTFLLRWQRPWQASRKQWIFGVVHITLYANWAAKRWHRNG